MKRRIFYFIAIISLVNSQALAQDSTTNIYKANQFVLIIAGALLLIWIVMVIVYLVWAIHRYNSNYGLSNHEWKILHPYMYADENERDEYIKLKNQIMVEKQNMAGDTELVTAPIEEPDENPYKLDSFGLPPNTIRGIIALTALFLFILMEGINYFSTIAVEDNFKELILALQMVIAFYFGSRAIEVFKARSEKQEKSDESTEKHEIIKKSAAVITPEKQTQVTEVVEEKVTPPVSETPPLPEEKTTERVISAIENTKKAQVAAETINKFKDDKSIQNRPLPERILALTGSFETSEGFPKCFTGLSNNFDGQGISFGVLQWNFGQGSLQPLLQKMNDNHTDLCKDIFGSLYYDFDKMLKLTKPEQAAWAKNIQYSQVKNGKVHWYLDPKWVQAFINLGLTDEMISIQTDAASLIYQKALKLSEDYELTTERGAALMFDITTQNGSVDRKGSGKKIREDYLKIAPGLSDDEIQTEKMTIIANRRAEVSNPTYVEDVRSRKLTIAKGEGKVHSKQYNLKDEFNITLSPFKV